MIDRLAGTAGEVRELGGDQLGLSSEQPSPLSVRVCVGGDVQRSVQAVQIPERWRPPPACGGGVAWIESVADAELHLASVTIGETQAGIACTREQDSAKADAIERWLDQVCSTFNILSMDGRAAAIAKVHQLRDQGGGG